MSGLDALIAKSIKSIVKDNLGDATFERIEKRLFERHGIGFTQAVEDFGKLDVVLREFFGDGAVGIERRIIDKIVILEESKRNEKKWITLEDSRLIELMLRSLGDDDILIPQGYVTTHDWKRVTKYKAVFENISISIEKNKIVVKVQPTLESIKNSHIMQIVCT